MYCIKTFRDFNSSLSNMNKEVTDYTNGMSQRTMDAYKRIRITRLTTTIIKNDPAISESAFKQAILLIDNTLSEEDISYGWNNKIHVNLKKTSNKGYRRFK